MFFFSHLAAKSYPYKFSEYIKSKAVIYGRDSSKKITTYQAQINSEAIKLALADPSLLQSRKALLEHARSKVNVNYRFKKGKSRSNSINNAKPPPKHQRTSDSIRTKHIGELEDDVKDISDRLLFKEKVRSQAELSRNYKMCDQSHTTS